MFVIRIGVFIYIEEMFYVVFIFVSLIKGGYDKMVVFF